MEGAPMDLRLVIFDCDGVLVDSEGPSNRVVAEEVTRLGLPMTEEEATSLFVGLRLSDIAPLVSARIGRRLSEEWVETLRQAMIRSFQVALDPIPGAPEALRAVGAMGLAYRVASNSSHEEMAVKFARTRLDALVAGRLHSARDVARGKPHPDVFLAAARAEGVPPASCVVVEDSVPGVTGAVAAGMRVLGFDPGGRNRTALRAAGAQTFEALRQLPGLLQRLGRGDAVR